MPSVSVNKNVTLEVPFENGLRNGGGRLVYRTSPGELYLYIDRDNKITLDKLAYVESLYAALGAIINAIKNES